MSQTYGIESPGKDTDIVAREHVHYVVVIDSDGAAVARLLLENRKQLQEFDASVPEVVQMIHGISPVKGALGQEWDSALAGHSLEERAAADVYTLKM